MKSESAYERIYLLVCQIPPGKVASYGQIAKLVGHCTPRMVGYAMAGLPFGSDVPWQRVINAQGKISPRGNAASTVRQRLMLEEEGVQFSVDERVDFKQYGWEGPEDAWMIENGFVFTYGLFDINTPDEDEEQ